MQQRTVNKSLNERVYNNQQSLGDAIGLPEPATDCTRDEYKQWYVASMFILNFRGAIYANNPLSAKIAATNQILKNTDYQDYIDYVEIALGRKLTEEETTRRCVISD